MPSARSLLYTHPAGITGLILLAAMHMLYTAALRPRLRHHAYELFTGSHHLYLLFVLALATHGQGCFVATADGTTCVGYFTWRYMGPALGLYLLLDRVPRAWRRWGCPASRRAGSHVLVKAVMHPGRVLEVGLKERFGSGRFVYKPGQYVMVCVADVAPFQWHPFTISSAMHPLDQGVFTLHIRKVGDWTQGLFDLLLARQAEESESSQSPRTSLANIRVWVEGPFGTPTEEVFSYPVAVLVAAGIGVTPSASILKSIWYHVRAVRATQRHDFGQGGGVTLISDHSTRSASRLKKLYFIWVARETEVSHRE